MAHGGVTKKRKAALVIGTRPEAIKMAPVVFAFRRHRDEFETQVVATAQHRELLDQVLGVFQITPDVDLDLMQEAQGLGDLTARLLMNLESLWRRTAPDVVVVQGDTTSSFAAALAAYYLKVPIGHVEAGLRSKDKHAPFPEEMNRRMVDALADYCFAPTEQSRTNLLAEGISDGRITVTGNTGIDALLWMQDHIQKIGFVPAQLHPVLDEGKKVVLVTAHRRESFGDGVQNICEAVKRISRSRPEVAIVYAVHPNPNVRGPVNEQLGGISNVYLMPPLDYATFVYAMARAQVILTDSGGIQEEVPSLGKPVLVMRKVTERSEAIDQGMAELVGTEVSRIVSRTLELLDHPPEMFSRANPFGDGHAGERIVQTLLEAVT